MRNSTIYTSDWAGGLAYPNYNTILIGVQPSTVDTWGIGTVAHELGHLVLAEYGQSCLGGQRPTWLEEGIAMYAEGGMQDSEETNLQNAIRNDELIPFRSLIGNFPAHDEGARLAYAQSYSLIQYMVDQFGLDTMQQFILFIAEGNSHDAGLRELYDLDIDQLENQWRSSIGAVEREALPTAVPINIADIATIPPVESAVDYPTPEGGVPLATRVANNITIHEDGTIETDRLTEPNSNSAILWGSLFCLLELLVGGWMFYLWRKKRNARNAKKSTWTPEEYL